MAAATPAVPVPGRSAPTTASTARLRDPWAYAVILAVVLFVLGPIVLGGSTPEASDGAQKIQTFYTDHSAKQTWAGVFIGLSGLSFVVFASSLLRSLRRVAGTDAAWPWLAFGASILVSAGMLIAGGMHIELAQDAKDLQPASAAALNSVDGGPWVALIGGLGLLALAVVAATWRARAIPRWAAWLGIVLGIGTITPLGWIIGLGTFLWLAGLGVMIAVRGLRLPESA